MTGTRSREYTLNRNWLKEKTRREEGTCRTCHRPFLWDVRFYHPLAFTAGHIIPIAEGGTDDRENLEPQHWGCNTSAGGILGNQRKRPVDQPAPIIANIGDPHSQQWP